MIRSNHVGTALAAAGRRRVSPPALAESGPFHRLMRRQSDVLLIGFSPWNTPPGRFRPYRTLLPLPWSLLFVNAPDNSWYLGGVPGLGATPGAVAEALARLIAASGCRRVATFGGSMGGFGALALGLDLGADVIVAHGCESLVGLAGSRSARGVRDATLIRAGRARVRGWRDRVRRHAGAIHCYYGETDIQDPLHAAYLEKLTGLASVPVRGAAHDVGRFIAERYGLERHLREILAGEAARFVAGFAAPPPPVRDAAQVYRRRTLGVAPEHCRLSAASPWPGTHMLRLVDALAAGDDAAAVAAAETAVRRRPDFAWFHYALILVLLGAADPARRLPVAVRRSYLPKRLGAAAAWHLAATDAVGDYHALLVETLDRAGRTVDGAAAAAEACRRCPDVAALATLRTRLSDQ